MAIQNAKARASWQRWRAISDRILNHPAYRHDTQDVRTLNVLLKLARFAHIQMGHFNRLAHGDRSAGWACFTGEYDGHVDRAKDRRAVQPRARSVAQGGAR